jgi:3-keto-disaccharide hydrolase
MSRLLALSIGLAVAGQAPAADDWVSLFNGKDLTGWETSLGVPVGGKDPVGVGRDPKGVFSVVEVDGKPAIRISGDGLGGLTTLKEYGNYHLELEFKWGEKRFPPRANEPRDSGLLYHGSDHSNPFTGWVESVEFGILEGGETGDFWSVPGAHGERLIVDVEGEDIPADKRRYPNEPIRYRPGGKKYVGTKLGILNGDDNEKPRGKWNKLDLYCAGQTGIHVVNGTVNLVFTNIRREANGKTEPVTRGRIQLQSEGAEVFYRNIRLRPITEIPAAIRQATSEPPANTLTEAEKADGWRLLFGGTSTKGWRGYRQMGTPAGWRARDGALVRVEKAGDLITEDQFGDFELVFDWKVSHGGNSGVFYRATEDTLHIYENAPEYEIRDSAFWTDNPYTNGANYALHPPAKDAVRPVGYWNRGRIVARGNAVEHWLNGEKVVSYELHTDDWRKRVQDTHIKNWKGYGQAARGHIGLQDYNDLLWFRNIKVRPLGKE